MREAADGRQFGADLPDPLLWSGTSHLLESDSHRRALSCLDEFLNSHAERAIADSTKRAIFQHDLWAVFDWAAEPNDYLPQRHELQIRLATAIRRLALTPDEARALPDNYAVAVASHRFARAYDQRNPQRPFLPPDLFLPDSSWICLSAYSGEPAGSLMHFTGRSRFLVFMRLPAGREATLSYIRRLRSSSQPPRIPNSRGAEVLNLAVPQFPAGTEVALIRQALLIDAQGTLVPASLTETIELRVYRTLTPGTPYENFLQDPASHDQDFFEFRMFRPELFAGQSGGLVAVHPDEAEYATFATHGDDPLESTESYARFLQPEPILERCRGCHTAEGIHSVQSRHQWMNPGPSAQTQGREENQSAIAAKLSRPDFKLLQQFWRPSPD